MKTKVLESIPQFSHTYADALPGGWTAETPESVQNPKLVYLNQKLADELGFKTQDASPENWAGFFAGNEMPPDHRIISQAYAGHQFGHFVPQLGDGRAHLLGEVLDAQGRRMDIALKGSGRTAFSRRGDGKAALGPMLREVLISTALEALSVPTSRSLAVVSTGAPVFREDVLPGAVLTRVASSHIRIGTFEYFAARGDWKNLRALLDYSIQRHYPELLDQGTSADQRTLEFFSKVMDRQSRLVAQWMGLGFIHGVMNTDNTSISGESIDFGPCAFMDAYHPETVFSSIDHGGRYAYGNQPGILHWNLARLAETLLPLLSQISKGGGSGTSGDFTDAEALDQVKNRLENFPHSYASAWMQVFSTKLGFDDNPRAKDNEDSQKRQQLIQDYLNIIRKAKADFTLAFFHLIKAAEGHPQNLRELFPQEHQRDLQAWLDRWQYHLAQSAGTNPAALMRSANPLIIPRNHKVEEALLSATAGNLDPFHQFIEALTRPFDSSATLLQYQGPAPLEFTANYRTFCGT
jgi:uncharacterized protein YdiU (UPF0061 family)